MWNLQPLWNEFTPHALLASLIMSALGAGVVIIARLAWKRLPKAVFWGLMGIFTWLVLFAAIQYSISILHAIKPIESARPYFTKVQSKIYQVSTTSGKKHPLTVLTVSVQNNNVPARNIVSQLMILDRRLDPTSRPLRTRRVANANEIGRFQNLSQHTPVNVGRNTKAAFVVFEIKYEDASSQTYSQKWFMKFEGSTRIGNFFPELFEADQNERFRIEAYIRQRSIPRLSTEASGSD